MCRSMVRDIAACIMASPVSQRLAGFQQPTDHLAVLGQYLIGELLRLPGVAHPLACPPCSRRTAASRQPRGGEKSPCIGARGGSAGARASLHPGICDRHSVLRLHVSGPGADILLIGPPAAAPLPISPARCRTPAMGGSDADVRPAAMEGLLSGSLPLNVRQQCGEYAENR